jgi:3-oxoacyl-(acyl-carrier-protein) synthase
MRRIVVTGMGAVTPLAAGVESSWSRLLAGGSGIRRLPDHVVGDLPAKVVGVVPSLGDDSEAGFDPDASTPVGDLGEIAAIKSVFRRDFATAVSATKSATGHLLGAAGGLGAIFAIPALRDQVAPPTLNLSVADPAADGIDFVANQWGWTTRSPMASASEE